MPSLRSEGCRVEYRADAIVIRGPHEAAQREARRIMRRFECSATPYRLVSADEEGVVLQPA